MKSIAGFSCRPGGYFDEAGVVIVKDSSANKCGVITSSYEIMASMMLSAEEFMGIKDELVEFLLDLPEGGGPSP